MYRKIISCIDRMRHRMLSDILKYLISEVTVAFQYAARHAQKTNKQKTEENREENKGS